MELRNEPRVKLKFPVHNYTLLKTLLEGLNAKFTSEYDIVDYYFNLVGYKCKIRMMDGVEDKGLVMDMASSRSNPKSNKPLESLNVVIPDPKKVIDDLKDIIGLEGVIEKHREVWDLEKHRVQFYVDHIKHLGTFVNFLIFINENENRMNRFRVLQSIGIYLGFTNRDVFYCSSLDIMKAYQTEDKHGSIKCNIPELEAYKTIKEDTLSKFFEHRKNSDKN